MNISSFSNVNIENIKLLKPEIKDENTYIASCKDNISFTTPKMKCINVIKYNNYSIFELEFNKNQWSFYKFIQSIDEHNIIQINNNSKDWFNQNFPLDVIDEFYHSNLKIKKSSDAPIFKLKVNNDFKILSNRGIELFMKDLINQFDMIINLNFIGLKFLRQQVFCEWKIEEMMIYNLTVPKDSIKNVFKNNNFSDDEFDEFEEPKKIKFKKIDFKKQRNVKFDDDKEYILDKTKKEIERYKKLYCKNDKEMKNFKEKINSILN